MRRYVWWAGLALTFLGAAAVGPAPALTLSVTPSAAQYEESLEIFPNPERGWFWPIDPECCGTDLPHPPIEVGRLRALRGRPEAITLVRDGVLLGRHMHEPIPRQTLNRIQADWDAARRAGMKVIVRFLYDWSLNNRDPEEAILAGHLDQLAPLLTANEDVIAAVEAGLFGGSGEGNRSDRGYVYFDPRRGGWHRLSEAGIRIYGRLLSRVPRSRQMLVRYPRFKWDLLGWSGAAAIPGADRRIGYYNDGWFGDGRHFAFFQLANERSFTEQDSREVMVGGEPSMPTATNLDPAASLQEMIKLHQTTLSLNQTDALPVYARWRASPQWTDMTRRLGYRIVLQKVLVEPVARNPGEVRLTAHFVNRGFARLMNPRPSVLVLRDRATRAMSRIPLRLDLRQVAPNSEGVLSAVEQVQLPTGSGSYDVGLHFPDAAPGIAHRVEYALRLASEGLWDPATGIHWLGIEIGSR